jgi:F-type H+-transporting ATPase subunit gamma
MITADRGMCGAYNLEACRTGLEFWQDRRRAGQRVRFILVGRRGAAYFTTRHADILRQERWPRAGVSSGQVDQLLALVLGYYRSGMVDEVHAAYTAFHSPIHREPRIVRVLPVELPAAQQEASLVSASLQWHYEPTRRALIEELVAVYLQMQLYDVLLESYASEYGARMITMEEASERADRNLAGYRVLYNRVRREAITLDLVSALMARRASEASPSEDRP